MITTNNVLGVQTFIYVIVADFITETSSSTGILLDPYYTGKGAMGMVRELSLHPERFKGKRILFIHTGYVQFAFESHHKKTCVQGFKPGSTQTGLYNHKMVRSLKFRI